MYYWVMYVPVTLKTANIQIPVWFAKRDDFQNDVNDANNEKLKYHKLQHAKNHRHLRLSEKQLIIIIAVITTRQ